MKQISILSLLLISFFMCSAQSGITYKNFGEGLVIPLNENVPIDMDEDGIIDFYVNQYENELGFTAIFGIGCFSSPNEQAYTSFDARELQVFNEGALVQITDFNIFDYIDDGRGSAYSSVGGLADGWIDKKDYYVGLAIILPESLGGVRNAWIKVSVNITTQELTIKEWAYTDIEDFGDGIIAGDTGEVTSVNNLEDIYALMISPNPGQDRISLSFNYSGNDPLTLVIQNNVGQEVYRMQKEPNNGKVNFQINTLDWINGAYLVRLETVKGMRTEQLIIAK